MAERNQQQVRHRSRSIAALLDGDNPWLFWLAQSGAEPLSQLRLVALLLRELPVSTLVDRLAPALLAAEAIGQEELHRHLVEQPQLTGQPFRFEHWLAWWKGTKGEPYATAVREAMRQVATTPDLKYFSEIDRFWPLDVGALLSLLLGGVRRWTWDKRNRDVLTENARWLFDLMAGGDTMDDPLSFLFAFLYQRHLTEAARQDITDLCVPGVDRNGRS